MKTTRLTVGGMTCDHCRRAVENALKASPGVRSATVDVQAGSAEVAYEEGAVSPEQLERFAIGLAGCPASRRPASWTTR